MFVCSLVSGIYERVSLPVLLELVLRAELSVRKVDAILSLISVDPEMNGVLALHAGVRVRWEPLLEWDAEDLHVHQIRVTLCHHPDVVSKDNARDEVNKVVSSQCNHQHNLHNASSEGEPAEAVPSERIKF